MINNVVLTGRLTRDPELRYSEGGVPFTIFTLAVDRKYKNNDGERIADFIDVLTWRKVAESCAEYLNKGSLVGVEGRLQIRKNKQEDRTYINTEVVASSVQFLERKDKIVAEDDQEKVEEEIEAPF